MNRYIFIVACANLLLGLLGTYHLTALARGLVPATSHNWNLTVAEILVSMVISYLCTFSSHYYASKPCSPENETADEILARYDRRNKQDLARKITGGLL
jgi:hypothetical protein